MAVVRMESKIEWKCFRARGGNWVAICDPLGLTIQSAAWATLMEDIAQTLNSMFRDLLKSGELVQFLRDRGWQPIGRIPLKPSNVRFDIPFTTSITDRDRQIALH